MKKASARGVRWRIPIVFAVTIFVNYLDRNNLALALPRIARDFGWSDREIGLNGEWLLAAFFISYALSNMLLSPLAERLGPKRSTIIAIVAFSFFTILSAPLGQSLTALIVLRLLLGLGEGVHIPMLSAIISRWFPVEERSRANALWSVGILLATATAPLLIVPFISTIGWRPTFALLGIAGMGISIPLVGFFVQDEPRLDKRVSEAELAHICCQQEMPNAAAMRITQNRHYVRDLRFGLATLGGSLNAFCAFSILNWLPIYFNRAKGIDFERLGWPLALVFAAGIAGIILMAYLGDKLQRRMLLAGGCFLLAGAMVYVASTVDSLPVLVLSFAIAVFCQSAYAAQEYAIIQRLLPAERVGAGTGLYNGISLLFGGVGGSIIPGSLVAATGNFAGAILSVAIGAWLAALVMFVLAQILDY